MTTIEPITHIREYLRYSPSSAILDGKSEDEQFAYNALFLMMSDTAREYLASTQVAETIHSWVQSGLVPETHGLAVAKIVGLVAFGDVSIQSIPDLLVKLDIAPEKAQKISEEIEKILQPITAERTEIELPEPPPMPELPPMSRPTENGPRVVTGPKVPARNIIDLRNRS